MYLKNDNTYLWFLEHVRICVEAKSRSLLIDVLKSNDELVTWENVSMSRFDAADWIKTIDRALDKQHGPTCQIETLPGGEMEYFVLLNSHAKGEKLYIRKVMIPVREEETFYLTFSHMASQYDSPVSSVTVKAERKDLEEFREFLVSSSKEEKEGEGVHTDA